MAHEQIEITKAGEGTCVGPCPHGHKYSGSITMVGSSACQFCDHFVEKHPELCATVVTCNFMGDMADKARDSAKDGPNV